MLELARELGRVAEACRRNGMDRTSFYEYKRRFQLQGLEGLQDLPPVATSHPLTIPAQVVQQIVDLALPHPAWGCNRLSRDLALSGVTISAPTVQQILNKQGLGPRYDRLLKLEERVATEPITLREEHIRLIEHANHAFREPHVGSCQPGQRLSQDTCYIGQPKGIGKLSRHPVVATFGSYTFTILHSTKQPEAAVAAVHNDAVPFYQARDITINAILTDNGRWTLR